MEEVVSTISSSNPQNVLARVGTAPSKDEQSLPEIKLEPVGPHRYVAALEKGSPVLSPEEKAEEATTSCCGLITLPPITVQRPFLRALEWATRQALAACAASGLACQVTAVGSVVGLSICFLAGVNSVVPSRPTMTASLQACFYGACGAVIGAMFAWAGVMLGRLSGIQNLFLGLYVPVIAVLLVYQNVPIGLKKTSLILLAAVSVSYGENPDLVWTAAPRSLLPVLLGYACTLASHLLPPWRSLYRNAVATTRRVHRRIVRAFEALSHEYADFPSPLVERLVQVRALLGQLSSTMREIQLQLGLVAWDLQVSSRDMHILRHHTALTLDLLGALHGAAEALAALSPTDLQRNFALYLAPHWKLLAVHFAELSSHIEPFAQRRLARSRSAVRQRAAAEPGWNDTFEALIQRLFVQYSEVRRKLIYESENSSSPSEEHLQDSMAFNFFLWNTVNTCRRAVLFMTTGSSPPSHRERCFPYFNFVTELVDGFCDWAPTLSDIVACFSLSTWKTFIFSERLILSIRVGIAVGIAGLFTFVSPIQEYFQSSNAVMITTVLVMERGFFAQSFNNFVTRLVGTASGAIWGYITVAYLDEYFYAVQLMLFAWLFVVGTIRSSPGFAPAAMIAQLTCVIVVFFPIGEGLTVEESVVKRIQDTLFGLIISLVVASLPPTSARSTLKTTVGQSLSLYAELISSALDVACSDAPSDPDPTLLSGIDRAFGLFAQQQQLLNFCEQEPALWRAPFPLTSYQSLLKHQRSLLYALRSMVRALAASPGDDFHTLISQVENSMDGIRLEIAHVFDELSDALVGEATDDCHLNPLHRLTVGQRFRELCSRTNAVLQLLQEQHQAGEIAAQHAAASEPTAVAGVALEFGTSEEMISTESMASFFAFLYALRKLTRSMTSLWETAVSLIAKHHLVLRDGRIGIGL